MGNKKEPLYQLNQDQLNAIVPVLNRSVNGELRTKKKLHSAIRDACKEGNCPIPDDVDMNTVFM